MQWENKHFNRINRNNNKNFKFNNQKMISHNRWIKIKCNFKITKLD